MNTFADVFPGKPIIGMVHLRALPGAPGYSGRMSEFIDSALFDANALQDGGVDGIVMENFFDAPRARRFAQSASITSRTLPRIAIDGSPPCTSSTSFNDVPRYRPAWASHIA